MILELNSKEREFLMEFSFNETITYKKLYSKSKGKNDMYGYKKHGEIWLHLSKQLLESNTLELKEETIDCIVSDIIDSYSYYMDELMHGALNYSKEELIEINNEQQYKEDILKKLSINIDDIKSIWDNMK